MSRPQLYSRCLLVKLKCQTFCIQNSKNCNCPMQEENILSNVKMEAQAEPNRLLKRNIGELAIDGKLNEDFKSPVRKEVKVSHETLLRRELEQWKDLMKERGIRRSVTPNELNDMDPSDFNSILKPDQKNFIAEVIDVRQMIQQSHDFRRKFDFFLRVNKLRLNALADKSSEALDAGKQQAIEFQNHFMRCEQFNPVEN